MRLPTIEQSKFGGVVPARTIWAAAGSSLRGGSQPNGCDLIAMIPFNRHVVSEYDRM